MERRTISIRYYRYADIARQNMRARQRVTGGANAKEKDMAAQALLLLLSAGDFVGGGAAHIDGAASRTLSII